MSRTQRAIALLALQAALVLSIAVKYVYERKTCPRVWVRATQFEPNQPLRGRYLGLQLALDACALPHDPSYHSGAIVGYTPPDRGFWRWRVRPVVENGKLVPILASYNDRPELTAELTVWGDGSCSRAKLSKTVEYFVADTAKTPFPLKTGEELWVEVTVPAMGPPRPIQLAMAKDGIFTPLNLR